MSAQQESKASRLANKGNSFHHEVLNTEVLGWTQFAETTFLTPSILMWSSWQTSKTRHQEEIAPIRTIIFFITYETNGLTAAVALLANF